LKRKTRKPYKTTATLVCRRIEKRKENNIKLEQTKSRSKEERNGPLERIEVRRESPPPSPAPIGSGEKRKKGKEKAHGLDWRGGGRGGPNSPLLPSK